MSGPLQFFEKIHFILGLPNKGVASEGGRSLLSQSLNDLSCVSAHGRKFLFFLFASALLSGPLANLLENMERTATSLLCGAEVAANQTQELVQRAATPLFCKTRFMYFIPLSSESEILSRIVLCEFTAGLDRIREISRNALSAAGRVRNFIDALTDSVRHIGEWFHLERQQTNKHTERI